MTNLKSIHYGEARVAKEWCSDDPISAHVRWRVKAALAQINGGYGVPVSGSS